jgi:hypothetical protein
MQEERSMRTAKIALFGLAAAAIAGAASAAGPEKHVMTVALPDGGSAHIEYYGDVAPKVTLDRTPVAPLSVGWAPMAFPDFASFGRIFEQIDRQREALMKQVQQMSSQGIGAAASPLSVASYGNMPAGPKRVSVVSVSNGGGTCTRTTEVTSQGPGKAPKVVTNLTGSCSPGASAPPGSKPTA